MLLLLKNVNRGKREQKDVKSKKNDVQNLVMVFLRVFSTKFMMPTSILLLFLVFILTPVFVTVSVFLVLFVLIPVLVLLMLPLLVFRFSFRFSCNGRDPFVCLLNNDTD